MLGKGALPAGVMVYMYIAMKRTQIYLSEVEARALKRRARESGRTVSDLIREAIDRTYLRDQGALLAALEKTQGAWSERELDGASYVDRMRRGRIAALHAHSRR